MTVEQPALTSHDLVLKHPVLNHYLNALSSASEGKEEARAELIALNAVLRSFGAPALTFGSPYGVPCGTMILHRTELVVLGMHRHFLGEMAFTLEGVESLVLTPESPCEDEGERVAYRGCGQTPAQRTASRSALATSAERGRPVRVLRAVSAEAATLALRAAGEAAGKRRREVFRYDGVYVVQRLVARDDDTDKAVAAADDDKDEPPFVLVRLPGQPALPTGAAIGKGGARKRLRDEEAERHVEPLALHAEAVGLAPSTTLPPAAEEICLGEGLSVDAALKLLHGARERLLAELTPQDRYVLAKRSALHQVRLRSALELLHAGSRANDGCREQKVAESSKQLSPPATVSGGARQGWPVRRGVVYKRV